MGCPKHYVLNVLGRVFPQPRSFKHFVSCCNTKSDPADEDCVSKPCKGPVTYNEAVDICHRRGRHLCVNTPKLQPNKCCGNGCNFENKWIWVGDHGIISAINIQTYEILSYHN